MTTRKSIPHTLVVRVIPGGGGLTEVCCPCRPRHASDVIGETIMDIGRHSPDEIAAAFHHHRGRAKSNPAGAAA